MSDIRQIFSLPKGAFLFAIGGVILALLLLAPLALFVGPTAAQAAYLGALLFLGPSRHLPGTWVLGAAAWAMGISILGYLIGPLGLGPLTLALIVVSLGQGLFRLDSVAALTRSPVNLVVYAGLADSRPEVPLWHVVLGTLVGVAIVLGAGRILEAHSKPIITAAPAPMTIRYRLRYGTMLAAGGAAILLISELVHFPYAPWALLSFCLILAVDEHDRSRLAGNRVLGTVAGVLLATAATLVPQPGPMILAVLSALACVAYLRVGKYGPFMMFLTPTIILTTSSDQPGYVLGIERIAAIAASAIIALACTWVAGMLDRRRHLGPRATRELVTGED